MLIKELLEKFQGILSEEEIKGAEDAINTLITEASEKAIDEQVEELVEASLQKIATVKTELTESFAREYADQLKSIRENDAREAALYIKTLTESQAVEVAEFVQNREKEITEALEAQMVSKIDTIIDNIVAENFTDEMAEKIALNETYGSIVEGMQQLLSSKHLNVDSEGYDTLKESKEIVSKQEQQIKALTESLAKVTAIVESVKSDAEVLKVEKLILEKTNGLSESQKKTVTLMCESVDTNIVGKKIDTFIESVLASENEDILNEEEEASTKTLVEDAVTLHPKVKAITESESMRKDTMSMFKRLVG